MAQLRPAGIRQPQHTRALIKRLARRVIHRLPQQGILPVILHADQVAVSPAGNQTYERRGQRGCAHKIGTYMPFDMVNRHQRQARSVAEALHAAHSGQQRTHQPRSVGNRQRVHVGKRHTRVRKGTVNHAIARIHMRAAGDLRHHAPVQGMHIHL